MGLFTKKKGTGGLADAEFIDLTSHDATGTSGAGLRVRVAELHRPEDVKALANLVYDGELLIVDFGPIASDEVALKRVMTEFRRVATDVDGDLAGVGSTFL
ncbi:MAG: cell division protein SepF, partial [bacterium]